MQAEQGETYDNNLSNQPFTPARFTPLTKPEIKAPRSKFDEIKELIRSAKAGEKVKDVDLGKVTTYQAAEIRARTGCNVAGYKKTLSTGATMHTIKKHGKESEVKDSQVGVVDDDFVEIPGIILNPDEILMGGKNPAGQDVILFRKKN